MDEIEITPAILEAGIDARAFFGDIDAETVVEVIYRAMAEAACLRIRGRRGLPHLRG